MRDEKSTIPPHVFKVELRFEHSDFSLSTIPPFVVVYNLKKKLKQKIIVFSLVISHLL